MYHRLYHPVLSSNPFVPQGHDTIGWGCLVKDEIQKVCIQYYILKSTVIVQYVEINFAKGGCAGINGLLRIVYTIALYAQFGHRGLKRFIRCDMAMRG